MPPLPVNEDLEPGELARLRRIVGASLAASLARDPRHWPAVVVRPSSKGARVAIRECVADDLRYHGLPELAAAVLSRPVGAGEVLALVVVVDGPDVARLALRIVRPAL